MLTFPTCFDNGPGNKIIQRLRTDLRTGHHGVIYMVMEKTHRDRLRMLGAVQIFVTILLYLLAAHLTSQTMRQEGGSAHLLSFLTTLFPILLLIGILGVAALAGRSWGFPLSVVTAVFLLGYAVVQTGVNRPPGVSVGLKTILLTAWLLAFYQVVFTVMYWNFLRGKET